MKTEMKNIKIVNASDTIEREFHGVKLVLARYKRSDALRRMRELAPEYPNPNQLSEDDQLELAARAMVGTVLVGWDNFYLNGELLEYSHENAEALMINDEDAREFVSEIAMNLDEFLVKDQDNMRKKSLPPSGGSLSSAAG